MLNQVALVIAVVVLYLPLLSQSGFFSHEDAGLYYRVLEYVQQVRDGHWLPQTFPRLFHGAGYAFPRFYPPLGNVVAAALTAITGNVVVGVHLSFLLSLVLSVLAMNLLVNKMTGARVSAFIGALAYTCVPYRFEVVFIRGALAECWTFVWFPLIVLGLFHVLFEHRRAAFLPWVIAGLLLTHPPMALYFGVTVVAPVLVFWHNRLDRRATLELLRAALFGVGLTAWYWLPQQYYLPTVWAGVPQAVWADAAHVQDNHVPWKTLLTGLPPRNALNLSIGWVPVLAHLLAAFGIASATSQVRYPDLRRWARYLLVPWWLLVLFMVYPAPVLHVLPAQFGYIQFPWRVLGPMAFLAATSLACSVAAAQTPWVNVVGFLTVIMTTIRAGVAPDARPEWTAAALQHNIAGGRRFGLTGRSEYLPRSVKGLVEDYDGALADLEEAIEASPRGSKGIKVLTFDRQGSAIDLVVEASVPGSLVLPTIYYDFYAARLTTGAAVEPRDSGGLLAINVPQGRHRIVLREQLTSVYWVGIITSLATLLCWVLAARLSARRLKEVL